MLCVLLLFSLPFCVLSDSSYSVCYRPPGGKCNPTLNIGGIPFSVVREAVKSDNETISSAMLNHKQSGISTTNFTIGPVLSETRRCAIGSESFFDGSVDCYLTTHVRVLLSEHGLMLGNGSGFFHVDPYQETLTITTILSLLTQYSYVKSGKLDGASVLCFDKTDGVYYGFNGDGENCLSFYKTKLHGTASVVIIPGNVPDIYDEISPSGDRYRYKKSHYIYKYPTNTIQVKFFYVNSEEDCDGQKATVAKFYGTSLCHKHLVTVPKVIEIRHCGGVGNATVIRRATASAENKTKGSSRKRRSSESDYETSDSDACVIGKECYSNDGKTYDKSCSCIGGHKTKMEKFRASASQGLHKFTKKYEDREIVCSLSIKGSGSSAEWFEQCPDYTYETVKALIADYNAESAELTDDMTTINNNFNVISTDFNELDKQVAQTVNSQITAILQVGRRQRSQQETISLDHAKLMSVTNQVTKLTKMEIVDRRTINQLSGDVVALHESSVSTVKSLYALQRLYQYDKHIKSLDIKVVTKYLDQVRKGLVTAGKTLVELGNWCFGYLNPPTDYHILKDYLHEIIPTLKPITVHDYIKRITMILEKVTFKPYFATMDPRWVAAHNREIGGGDYNGNNVKVCYQPSGMNKLNPLKWKSYLVCRTTEKAKEFYRSFRDWFIIAGVLIFLALTMPCIVLLCRQIASSAF